MPYQGDAVNRATLTQAEAKAIVDAHEIRLDKDDEETEMLSEQNPLLFAAYERLLKIANGQ